MLLSWTFLVEFRALFYVRSRRFSRRGKEEVCDICIEFKRGILLVVFFGLFVIGGLLGFEFFLVS